MGTALSVVSFASVAVVASSPAILIEATGLTDEEIAARLNDGYLAPLVRPDMVARWRTGQSSSPHHLQGRIARLSRPDAAPGLAETG